MLTRLPRRCDNQADSASALSGSSGTRISRGIFAVGSTSWVFATGHRIRLEVSSSNFPRFDRNTNTGDAIRGAMALGAQTARMDSAWWGVSLAIPG